MKYSLQDGRVPIYERDENGDIVYIEVDGNKVPVETGEYETGYSAPVDFMGNISMSGGEAEAKEFGMDIYMVPPEENPVPSAATEEDIRRNAVRLAYEDSVRAARPHGNADVEAFRKKYAGENAEALLASLSVKDLGDVREDVLEEYMACIEKGDFYHAEYNSQTQVCRPFPFAVSDSAGYDWSLLSKI